MLVVAAIPEIDIFKNTEQFRMMVQAKVLAVEALAKEHNSKGAKAVAVGAWAKECILVDDWYDKPAFTVQTLLPHLILSCKLRDVMLSFQVFV